MRKLFFLILFVPTAAYCSDFLESVREIIDNDEVYEAVLNSEGELSEIISSDSVLMERIHVANSICGSQCTQCFDGFECDWKCAKKSCDENGDDP